MRVDPEYVTIQNTVPLLQPHLQLELIPTRAFIDADGSTDHNLHNLIHSGFLPEAKIIPEIRTNPQYRQGLRLPTSSKCF